MSHLDPSPALSFVDWEFIIAFFQGVCRFIIDRIPEHNATEIHKICRRFLDITTPKNDTLEIVDISRQSKEVLTVLYCMVITFALVGNIGVIAVFAKNKSFRGAVTIPILSLAISNLLVAVCCMPFNLANIMNRTWDFGAFGEFACKLVPYMQVTTAVANTLTLGCIALERYMAVLHPLKSRSHQSTPRTLTILGCIWVLAVLVSIPNLIWYSMVHVTKLVTDRGISLDDIFTATGEFYCIPSPEHLQAMTYYRFIILLGVFGSSFVGMVVAYVRISYTLSIRKPPGDSASQVELLHVKTSRRVITMLVTVQVLFFLCWAPILVFEALVPVLEVEITETSLNVKYYLLWLAESNSCHNPLIYTFLHEKFRKHFTSVFCCCCGCCKAKSEVAPVAETSSNKSSSSPKKVNTGESKVAQD